MNRSLSHFETRPPRSFAVSEKLSLRLFEPKDAKNLLRLVTEESVVRSIPWAPAIKDERDALHAIDQSENLYQQGVRARYVLESDGAFLGYVGIWPEKPERYYEFGFALLPEFRRSGYGTSAVRALMQLAQNELGAKGMVAYVNDDNLASQKAVLSLGLQRTDTIDKEDRRYEYPFKKA